jgi:hypothetical protein
LSRCPNQEGFQKYNTHTLSYGSYG